MDLPIKGVFFYEPIGQVSVRGTSLKTPVYIIIKTTFLRETRTPMIESVIIFSLLIPIRNVIITRDLWPSTHVFTCRARGSGTTERLNYAHVAVVCEPVARNEMDFPLCPKLKRSPLLMVQFYDRGFGRASANRYWIVIYIKKKKTKDKTKIRA